MQCIPTAEVQAEESLHPTMEEFKEIIVYFRWCDTIKVLRSSHNHIP